MQITELRAENFRLFETLNLRFSRSPVVFTGDNAAGKTSLLEMLYSLGRGRSFRAQGHGELAGPRARCWTVFARTCDEHGLDHGLGVRWADQALVQRVDTQAASAVELLKRLPLQILEPGMHRVLEDGPTYRRSFIDWGVFHVEQSFMPTWRRYRRALRQRNQVLRQRGSDRELAVWEPELAEAGQSLHRQRLAHVEALRPELERLVAEWLPDKALGLELQPGWAGTDLMASLVDGRERDRRLATTAIGPHRAELRMRVDAHGARGRISRGQQKLLLASLLLAQCAQIRGQVGVQPTLLIDDFAAELAPGFQQWLLAQLMSYAGPVFISNFDRGPFASAACEMFHVEHGTVRA